MAAHHSKRLLELIGKLEWDATFDYKAERTRHAVEQSGEAHQRKTLKRSKPKP